MSYSGAGSPAATWESGRLDQARLMERAKAGMRAQGRATWFIWIAGLTLLNSLFALLHLQVVSGLGLTLTQIVDEVGIQATGDSRVTAAALDVLAIALFLGLGLLARSHKQWAFVLGLVLYIGDAVLLAGLFGLAWQADPARIDIPFFAISGAIHAYAIFRLSQGVAENQKFRELGRLLERKAEAPLTPPGGPQGPTYIISY